MNGKNKCKILKQIRRQIAADNDIAFVTSECQYQGECTGTCPKCEAELQYLENELAKRQRTGKAVAVAGIAATILVSTAGCLPDQTAGDPLPPSTTESIATELPPGAIPPPPTMGEIVETEPPMGVPMPDPTEAPEIMGDILPPQE